MMIFNFSKEPHSHDFLAFVFPINNSSSMSYLTHENSLVKNTHTKPIVYHLMMISNAQFITPPEDGMVHTMSYLVAC